MISVSPKTLSRFTRTKRDLDMIDEYMRNNPDFWTSNIQSFSTALAFSREGGRVVSGGRWRFIYRAVGGLKIEN